MLITRHGKQQNAHMFVIIAMEKKLHTQRIIPNKNVLHELFRKNNLFIYPEYLRCSKPAYSANLVRIGKINWVIFEVFMEKNLYCTQ